MSARNNHSTFAHVSVKEEPYDGTVEVMVDGIAHGNDDQDTDDGQQNYDNDVEDELSVEVDPMSIVKIETVTSDTEEPDTHWEPDHAEGNHAEADHAEGNHAEADHVEGNYVEADHIDEDYPEGDHEWVPCSTPVRTKRGLKYLCPYCPYKAILNVLRNHVRKHTGKKDFKCQFCEFSSNYNTALRRHMKSQHPADSDEEMKTKKKKVHVKKYQCTLCPYVTAHQHGLRSHMEGIHQDEKRHICSFCDFRTKYPTAMRRHRFTQHKAEVKELGEANKEFQCSSCNFVAFFKAELRQHEKKHLLKFRCEKCRTKFVDRQDLDQHIRQQHNKNGFTQTQIVVKSEKPEVAQGLSDGIDPIFKCKICQHESVTYAAFLEHVNTHDKDQYKCSVCGYETACSSTLLQHLQMEHGVTEDSMNDVKVLSEGIAQAIATGGGLSNFLYYMALKGESSKLHNQDGHSPEHSRKHSPEHSPKHSPEHSPERAARSMAHCTSLSIT